ncbi:MAG: zinc-dependent metalloprotease [Planctomycetota bacterium]
MGLALLTGLLGASAASAQDAPERERQEQRRPGKREKLDLSELMEAMPKGLGILGEGGGVKLPPFQSVTKGMVAQKGLFTLWSYPPGTPDKDGQRLLCQVPTGTLGHKFMISTSISGGGFFTGFPLDERCVYWELLDDQLLLIEPETRMTGEGTVADLVKRTYPERIRVAVPLVTRAPSGDPVFDLGALLKSSFADIAWMTEGGAGLFGFNFGGGGINPSLSKWAAAPKVFPQNVEVSVDLAVSRAEPPGSYDKKRIHYSLWALPGTGYQPRVADDRVGYFLTTNVDWSKPVDARELFNRYVDRWQLEKRDPSLEECMPKQPIVYYVEKTVPVRYRRAVRDGILEWNKAFERIGFLNAIEVRQQTEDNEWKDLDPEDMRYSFFRWVVNGAGFAMGPHRSNPFTGQIYDADIIFDDGMVRFYEEAAGQLMPDGLAAAKGQDQLLRRFFGEHPELLRPSRTWQRLVLGDGEREGVLAAMRARATERGRHLCEYSQGMQQQLALARALLNAQGKRPREKFLYDVIKEVVMHEVGHTLGLRHNFAASTVWDLKEIRDRREKGLPTVGSVMDYNPILFFEGDEKLKDPARGTFVTPTIGPYDLWAIEYGYRPFDGKYQDPNAKAEGKGGKGKDGEGKDGKGEGGKAPATPKPAEMPQMPQLPQGFKLDKAQLEEALKQIPKEMLEMMPPDMRQALQSGDLQKLLGELPDLGGEMPSFEGGVVTPGGAADGSGFASAPPGELGMLQAIARRSAEPELVYATDEDTTFLSPDPRANRFDMGKDPLEWARLRMKLADERLAKILEWAVKDRESWYHLRQTFLRLVFEKVQVVDYVSRLIGGQRFNRMHRGDPGARPPFEPLPAKVQREALELVLDVALVKGFFKPTPELLNHLAPHRWWHDGMSIDFVMDFPVHELEGVLQWWVLFDRLFPNNLRRIQDAELKTAAADRLGIAEYLTKLQEAAFGDAVDQSRLAAGTWSPTAPFLSDARRSAQREYLGLMEGLIRRKPGETVSPDLHAMLQYALKRLAKGLEKTAGTERADFASQAHLVACQSRIERMLSASLEEEKPFVMPLLFGRTANEAQRELQRRRR